MRGESDSGSPGGGGPEFRSMKRRRSQRSPVVWGVAVVVLLGGAGLGYYFWAQDEGEEPQELPETTQVEEPEEEDPVAPEEPDDEVDEPSEDLPELEVSDAFIRDLAAELSENPELAAWLAPDDLVHRFVGVVVSVAGGTSPVEHVEHMEPGGDFQVHDDGGRFLIHPASYERYDVIGHTVAALDVEGTAAIYRELSPLFQEAYDELGLSDEPFDEVFARAAGQLLAPDPPEPPVEVEPFDAGYEYADEDLAGLNDAQKHLLRMGPENMERVQGQLQEILRELELSPVHP